VSGAHINALSLAKELSAAAVLLGGAGVALRGRGSRLANLFLIICIGAAGWLGFFGAMHGAGSSDQALMLARIGMLMVAIIPAGVFHFAAIYSGREARLRSAVISCWIFNLAAGVAFVASPLLIPSVVQY